MRMLNTVALFLAMVAAGASDAAAQKPAAAAGSPAAPAGAAAQAQSAGAATPALKEYYRIELAPSGSYIAIGALVTKGNAVVFHAYPDGNVMSLRKTDIRNVSPITAQEAAAPSKREAVAIRDLPMQGASGGVPGSGGAGHPAGLPGGAAAAGAAHPSAGAAASPGSAVRPTNVGPAVIPVRDGVAVTTAPPPD